jgi:RNA polymerase sporulation-specific sigma factor
MQKLVEDIKQNIHRGQNLTILIEDLKPLIYSMIKKYGYCEDSVEDAYQSSIEILLISIDDYDKEKKLPYVLYFKNRLFYSYMEKIKAKKKTDVVPVEEIFDDQMLDLDSNNKDFAENLIWQGDRIMLKDAMDKLSDRQRWILKEHYFKGRKLVDVAKEYDIHYQSLVKLKKRSLDKLKILYHRSTAV